jgi:Mrp family chromosome partitioning ATPase
MGQLTSEHPRSISRTAWLTARARNTVHRPVFIGAVGIGTALAALGAVAIAPQEVRHPAKISADALGPRPDTVSFIAALSQARVRLSAADSSLAAARVRVTAAPKPTVDTVTTVVASQRDTLSAAVSDLDALLARVETAPLPASYKALGESPKVASDPHVKALLDSLAEVERERESYGTGNETDPAYIALSSRSSQIGQEIQVLAQQRRDALRQQIATLNVPAQRQILAEAPAVDTAGWVAERDTAQSMVRQASTALDDERSKAVDYDKAIVAQREEAALNAPLYAVLSAALVLGVALGFGAAFFGEMRHPRVSDEHEVERVTGARVLATIRPERKDPERDRRLADRNAPPYFDPRAAGYQLTYLHVARTGASRLMLTISGSDTGIAAIVASNVAAIAADEARSTIIIDTDAKTSPVAAALRTHAEPGLADVVRRHIDWAEVTTQTAVGRDRVVDILPSGVENTELEASAVTAMFAQEGARLARHYEAIVIVASGAQIAAGLPGVLPIHDVILCARVGHTRFSDLRASLDGVRAAGGNPLGVVLWNAPAPSLPSPDRIAAAPRPIGTAEMRALTTR